MLAAELTAGAAGQAGDPAGDREVGCGTASGAPAAPPYPYGTRAPEPNAAKARRGGAGPLRPRQGAAHSSHSRTLASSVTRASATAASSIISSRSRSPASRYRRRSSTTWA